jgi:hypothetical protein
MKILTRITPHTRANENFNDKKREEKTARKLKRQKSPRNSNARGHTEITRKTDSLNKISMPRPKQ